MSASRNILLFLLLSLGASSAFADAAFVQEVVGGVVVDFGSAKTVTFSSNVGAAGDGRHIVVLLAVGATAGTISCSDTASNSYSQVVGGGATGVSALIAMAPVTTGGFTQVSCSHSNAGNGRLYAAEVTGLDGTTSSGSNSCVSSCGTTYNTSSSALSGTGFVLSGAQTGSNATYTAGAGFSNVTGNSHSRYVQRSTTTPHTLSSNVCSFDVASATNFGGACAIFHETVAPPPAGGARRTLMGVGK